MQQYVSEPVNISAIVPNYNMAHLLPAALDSLLAQSVPFTEIIVVDDGSTDNSVAVLEDYMQRHSSLRIVRHEKNQGVLGALNTGIKAASGEFVMLCAADDTYGSKVVEKSLPVIQAYPNVGLICGDAVVERFDLNAPFYRTLPFTPNQFISANEFKAMAKRGYVGFNGGGGMLINRRAILAAGMLHADSRWHGDWILYFVAAFRHGVYYVNEVFTYINLRQHAYSEGKRQKSVQDAVMLATVGIINNHYPELWNDFREAALLPHYAIRYIKLFLQDKTARRFMTPRLIWKMLINNAMVVRVGRLFPYRMILGMRKLLKA